MLSSENVCRTLVEPEVGEEKLTWAGLTSHSGLSPPPSLSPDILQVKTRRREFSFDQVSRSEGQVTSELTCRRRCLTHLRTNSHINGQLVSVMSEQIRTYNQPSAC